MQRPDWLRPGGALGAALGLVGAVVMTGYGMTEEVKTADVIGVARLDDGKLAPHAEVHLETYNETNDLSGIITLRTVTDDRGRFQFHHVPEGFAILSAYAPGYEAQDGVIVGFDKKEVDLELSWKGDEMDLATNQPVFTPDERPTIVLNGLTRRKDVTVSIFAFSEQQIEQQRDMYQLARNIAYNRYTNDVPGKELKPSQSFSHPIRTRDIQGKYAETVELPQLKEGLYIVRAETDDQSRSQWLIVSRLGLISKVSPKGVMGYVVDITSGMPVRGVDMEIVGPQGCTKLGKSDANGMVRLTGGPKGDGNYVMSATQGSSRAFAMFNWWSNSYGQLAATHVVTDRTVYRPGDLVQYKGFVRVPTNDGYKLPSYRQVSVTVFDPDDTQLSQDTRPLSAMGGYDGSFKTLPETAGTYRIEVEIDGQTESNYVQVAAYRKPEFSITVTPLRPFYYRGDRAEFKVKATYFTGEPLVGADLSASASRSDVWHWSPFDDEEYQWWADESGDYSYGGDYIDEFKATTDENGEAIVSVQTTERQAVEHDWWWTDSDQSYTLDVSGSDASGRYFEGKGSVDVVRGDVDLTAAFEDYVVTPGASAKLKVRAVQYGTSKPVVGAAVHVEFGETEWSGNKTREKKRGEWDVQLDNNGEALLDFVPKTSGDYYAHLTMRDSTGRTVTSRDSLWVYKYGGGFGGPAPKLQLVLNKKQYRVGESATAVIRTEKPGGEAWVTVESDDVVWSKLVPLSGDFAAVEIPVTRSFRPNVSIEVCYIKDKTYSTSHRTLVVGREDDTLDVQVVPDTKVTLPGGTVGYTVTAKDAQGKPVQADVAVSVVDEGVYAVREDHSDPVQSFYPSRWSSVQTYYSFPEIYLDGDDKSPVDVQVRTDFRDTAFWVPSVVTDANGTAKITVKLPENLTSWRTTATAVTADARAGKGRTDVIARKPVMVRLSPPAYMVQDESQTVGASVANETDQAQDFDVRIQTSGVDAAGQAVQRLSIGAHKSGRVTWQLNATRPGEAKVRVTAVGTRSGQGDGLERAFPVSTNGPTVSSYASADTMGAATMTVQHDAKAITGGLTVSVSPSMLGVIAGSLDGLVDYPYGCVEQTMDRFMPAVVVRQFLQQAGIKDPSLDRKIADVAEKSVARLKNFQHSDGGFGWWQYDGSSPGMTALVLEGLYHAEKAGYPIDDHMRDRAISWGKERLKSGMSGYYYKTEFVRLAYALSLYGVDPSAWVVGLQEPSMAKDDPESLAYTVLAISAANGALPEKYAKFKDEAYKELLACADEGDTTLSWQSKWWYQPTAVALRAVLAVDPKSPRASKAMRFLISARRGRVWTSTCDTTQVILAALDYLRLSGEAKSGLDATVTVAGVAHKFHFETGDWASQKSVTVPATSLATGANAMQVQVSGQGRAYVTSLLTESLYDPAPRPHDSGNGLVIRRDYYRMEAVRQADGTLRLVPSNRPVIRVRPGEVLHCRLTITSDSRREYVMVEDPALSNAHVIDTGDIEQNDWTYWWSDQTFLDDHAAIFMYDLQPGTNIVEYAVRAEAPGLSIALPATVSMMYQPDIRAMTGTDRIEVRQ